MFDAQPRGPTFQFDHNSFLFFGRRLLSSRLRSSHQHIISSSPQAVAAQAFLKLVKPAIKPKKPITPEFKPTPSG